MLCFHVLFLIMNSTNTLPGTSLDTSPRRFRVLHADDHDGMRRSFVRALNSNMFSSDHADRALVDLISVESGTQALAVLALADQPPFNLVVTDMEMEYKNAGNMVARDAISRGVFTMVFSSNPMLDADISGSSLISSIHKPELIKLMDAVSVRFAFWKNGKVV